MKKQLVNYILWLVFCLVGGVLGAWLYDYSVNRYIGNFAGSNAMSRYDSGSSVIIRDAKKVVIEQNEKIIETINASENVLLGLFKKNNTGQYNLAKADGQGLVLTSDGWLITNLVSADKNWERDYVAIDKNGKIFQLDRHIDDESGLSFAHLVGAQGLMVAEFMRVSDVRRGQTVLVAGWLNDVSQDLIIKTDVSPEAVKSSDRATKQLLLADDYKESKVLVVMDLSAKVLGLFNKEKKLLAADYFIDKTGELLTDKKNRAPVMGVNYYNLAWQLRADQPRQGAWLVKNGQVPAVLAGSAAERAGLKEGDVILALDDLVLTRTVDLGDLLADYRPGDKVVVRYLRAGKERTTELVLADK
jgi:hypothetical protein